MSRAVGEDVTDFAAGDRVAYGISPLGSYSDSRNYPADKLLHLPADMDDRHVTALLMKGMIAHYLLHRAIESGTTSGATVLIL